ncbi:MAG: hypothetical protein R3B70_34105 [Polyangiaceae bacterium]
MNADVLLDESTFATTPKSGNEHARPVLARGEEEVLGLEIAVNDRSLVEADERGGDTASNAAVSTALIGPGIDAAPGSSPRRSAPITVRKVRDVVDKRRARRRCSGGGSCRRRAPLA